MTIKTTKVGPGTLTIGATGSLTEFSSQAKNARVVPDVETSDPFYVLSGEQAEGDRTESWQLAGTLVQDFGQDDSTTEWLFEHRGERHPFTYTPNSSTGKQITGELIVEAIEIGGDANTKPTSDFEFVVIGQPVIGTVAG